MLLAEAREHRARGFVVRVLGDEFSFECAREDGRAEALGAGELGADGGLGLVGDGEEAVDLGDDAVLLGEGWKRNAILAQIFEMNVYEPRALWNHLLLDLRR